LTKKERKKGTLTDSTLLQFHVDLTKTTGDDANIWRRPDPKKDFVLAVAFAVQRGYAAQIRSCAPTRVAAIVALQPSSNMKI
jgi:hypothetical protein